MKALLLTLLFTVSVQAQANLAVEYNRIHLEAIQLAGRPQDIQQRVAQLKKMYLDSNGRYAFPLVAAHGAKYADKIFSITQTASELFSITTWLIDSAETTQIDQLNLLVYDLTNELEDVNRFVFIDTYTNYYFAKKYGRMIGADKFIPTQLLQHLNKMLTIPVYTAEAKRELFHHALMYEQHSRVSPMIKRVCGGFSEQWLLPLIMQPQVQFSYFPENVKFKFKDFSSEEERVYYALKSYDLAAQVGWPHVLNTL